MRHRSYYISKAGFTLIELLVVISIISLLSSIVLTSVNSARGKARDARRLADLRQIQNALALYYDDNGSYPPVTYGPGGSLAGWEVSYKDTSNWLNQLKSYMPSVPVDPTNRGNEPIDMFFSPRPADGNFFYMYYNYGAGSYYGCPWASAFAVVGFRAVEKMDAATLPKARCGPQNPPCPRGGISNVCRDWSTEFDYSVLMVP